MSKKGKELDPQTFPRARENDLSITVLGDETVVYDQLTHKAYCLNAVTAIVWKASNGKKMLSDLVDTLRQSGFQDASEDIVNLALSELFQAGLLLGLPQVTDSRTYNKSRREILRTIGKGAIVAIPAISMVSIQPAIAGVSCSDLGQPCGAGGGGLSCCEGLICNGVICVTP